MNFYVELINDVVDYIEQSMSEKLSLSMIAQQFGISDFHFNRMFKTVYINEIEAYKCIEYRCLKAAAITLWK